MKIKGFYMLFMILVAVLLIWEQSKVVPNVWIQIIGIGFFFFGMMKLSAKTPSKSQDNQEE